jgi:predicted phosphate transport protein (TIGR00153 family)
VLPAIVGGDGVAKNQPALGAESRRITQEHGRLSPGRELLMVSIANLIRGSGREYFDLFERAGANVKRAGELLDAMLAGFPDTQGLAKDILACERDGDEITHELSRRLNQTFVTPIDRQDILDLASSLDDIVDYTEEVADYLGLYKIDAPMAQAQSLAHVLEQATREIALAIPLLRGFRDISQAIDATERAADILEGIVIKNA